MKQSQKRRNVVPCYVLLVILFEALGYAHSVSPHYEQGPEKDVLPYRSFIGPHAKVVSRLGHRVGRAEDFPTPAAAFEPVPCPTHQCDCTRDTDRNPTFYQINCRHKRLNSIPDFQDISIVYDELAIALGNNIKEIPYAAFQNLKVKKIDLLSNDVEIISDGAFLGLNSYLNALYLQGNGQIPIPFHQLSNLEQLTELKLVNFKANEIPSQNKFESFPNLETLEFSRISGLVYIDPKAFSGKLQKLKNIVFDTVHFTQIPIEALEQLSSIQKLTIQGGELHSIYSKSFAGDNLQGLTELVLQGNNINTLKDDAFENVSKSLQVIDFTNNRLTKESLKAFENSRWPKLHTLNLSYNSRIGSLSTSVFRYMPNLQYLSLLSINLQVVSPVMFMGLGSLHTLDISDNRIQNIQQGSFKYMPYLKDLRLDNDPDEYPQTIALDLSSAVFEGVAASITHLSVSGNQLRLDLFWDMIKALSEIKELRARNVGINNIPNNAFKQNVKLHLIDLGNNLIASLPNSAFLGLENSLRQLFLDSNSLTTMSECVLKKNSGLITLLLSGNQMICDCRLRWLLEKKNSTKLDRLFCEGPELVKSQNLYDLSVEELGCSGDLNTECHYVTQSPATSSPSASITTELIQSTTPSKTTTLSTTTESIASITMFVGAITQTSFTIYWDVKGTEASIRVFTINLTSIIDNVVMTYTVSSGAREYTVTGLKPALDYKMCVTAKFVTQSYEGLFDCKTRSTLSNKESSSGLQKETGHNYIVIILVTSVIVVVLIVAGMCVVVKYKIQKLKEMRLFLTSPGIGRRGGPTTDYCSREESSTCTIPNDYVELSKARETVDKYKTYTNKYMKAYDKNNTYHDRTYSTYQKVKPKKHKHPKKEEHQPDESDKVEYTEVNEQFKSELEQRHSAPSRLDAHDLLSVGKDRRNSRPLPATPFQAEKGAKQTGQEQKAGESHVFMTQASVYESGTIDNDIVDKQEEIYHEIS